jgi:CxxC-x17-CxxC domain-containing protein
MEFQDVLLTCQDCGQTFTFTAGEQAFYQERGFLRPKRCKPCRSDRKAARSGAGSQGPRGPRELHDAVCSLCGAPTQVPFKPTAGRPVYCRPCFSTQRG